jgi:phage shock protein PspC (stress-responsive transcriptional regulator)
MVTAPRDFCSPVTRPLVRPHAPRVVFGVCSGLAARFEIDPFWFRLAFVGMALLFGKGVLLYLILTAVMPSQPATYPGMA